MKDNIYSELQMESPDLKNRGFRLSEHPWISLFVLVVLMVSSLIACRKFLQIISLTGYEINPINETVFGTVVGIVLFFGIVPFVLGLPHERTSLSEYLF